MLKKTEEIVKAYGNGIKLANISFQMFKRKGRGQRRFEKLTCKIGKVGYPLQGSGKGGKYKSQAPN